MENKTTIERAKEASDMVERGVNSFSNEFSREFVGNLQKMHKTLQQSFQREIVMLWIKEMAKNENYDGRNEATVKQCKAIVEFLEKNEMLGLPMI